MSKRNIFSILLIVVFVYCCYLFSPVLYIRFEIANQLQRLAASYPEVKPVEIERNLKKFITQLGQEITVKDVKIAPETGAVSVSYSQTVCFVSDWKPACQLRIDHNLSS